MPGLSDSTAYIKLEDIGITGQVAGMSLWELVHEVHRVVKSNFDDGPGGKVRRLMWEDVKTNLHFSIPLYFDSMPHRCGVVVNYLGRVMMRHHRPCIEARKLLGLPAVAVDLRANDGRLEEITMEQEK